MTCCKFIRIHRHLCHWYAFVSSPPLCPSSRASSSLLLHRASSLWCRKTEKAPEGVVFGPGWPIRREPGLRNQNFTTLLLAQGARGATSQHARQGAACVNDKYARFTFTTSCTLLLCWICACEDEFVHPRRRKVLVGFNICTGDFLHECDSNVLDSGCFREGLSEGSFLVVRSF